MPRVLIHKELVDVEEASLAIVSAQAKKAAAALRRSVGMKQPSGASAVAADAYFMPTESDDVPLAQTEADVEHGDDRLPELAVGGRSSSNCCAWRNTGMALLLIVTFAAGG
eukprot:7367097-Prymnesium_polylepis.1